MKKHAKIFAVVTAIALVLGAFSFASCSNSPDSSSDDDSKGSNTQQKSDEEKKWDETLEKALAYVKLDDNVEGVDKSDGKLDDYNKNYDNLVDAIDAAKIVIKQNIDGGIDADIAYSTATSNVDGYLQSIELTYNFLNETNKKLAKSGKSESGDSSDKSDSSDKGDSSGNGNSSDKGDSSSNGNSSDKGDSSGNGKPTDNDTPSGNDKPSDNDIPSGNDGDFGEDDGMDYIPLANPTTAEAQAYNAAVERLYAKLEAIFGNGEEGSEPTGEQIQELEALSTAVEEAYNNLSADEKKAAKQEFQH